VLKVTQPLFVYHVPGLGDLLEPPSKQEDAFANAILLPRMPPNMHEDVVDRGGWFWFDDVGPICIGPFIAMGRRQYHKTIPSGLFQETLRIECEKWCKTNNAQRVPKPIRRYLKEGVQKDLLKSTMPAIRESAVMFDVVQERLYLFHASENVRGDIWARVRKLSADPDWRKAFGSMRQCEVTLQGYLEQLRPGVVLPDRLNEHFTAFLFDHAKEGHWFHLKPSDGGDSVRFGLELSHVVEMESGDVKIVAKGDVTLPDVVEHAQAKNGDSTTSLKRIRIRIVTPGDRSFLVRIDDEGRSAQVRIEEPITVGAETYDTSISADVLSRATDWHYAHELMLALYRTFDAMFIGPAIKQAGQTQMFPGGPAATVKTIPEDREEKHANAIGTPDVGGGIFSWKAPLGVMYTGADATVGVDAPPEPHPDDASKPQKGARTTDKKADRLIDAEKTVKKQRAKKDEQSRKDAMKTTIDAKAIASKVKDMSGVEARNFLSMVTNVEALKMIAAEDTRAIVQQKCKQRLSTLVKE